ncbi:uncharacterized protein DS421_14g474480 [Arachis hypogaea]|nr:uncharacterized protein DS421_14g474480 [Arachis hypogaea]
MGIVLSKSILFQKDLNWWLPWTTGWPPKNGKGKLLNGETNKSICTILEEKCQLEQPVHLYISECTEDGTIFKCGKVDTDLHGLVIFFPTPTFYFICLFIIAFACLIAYLFDFLCIFYHHLVKVIFSFSRNFLYHFTNLN